MSSKPQKPPLVPHLDMVESLCRQSRSAKRHATTFVELEYLDDVLKVVNAAAYRLAKSTTARVPPPNAERRLIALRQLTLNLLLEALTE